MDATIDIRAIEIQRGSVTLDEYFELRRWNDAMPAMCYFGAYVDPALTRGFHGGAGLTACRERRMVL